MDSKQEKIRLLSRVNRQRAAAPHFFAVLSNTLDEPVDPASLLGSAEADLMLRTFRNGYEGVVGSDATSFRRFFRINEQRVVIRFAACLGLHLAGEQGFFITKIGGQTAAVMVKVGALLKSAESVIALDGDSLSALSADHKEGILIDHNEGEIDEAYEVAVWGNRWPLMALACDQI